MSDRKVFHDSVVPLPQQPGPTANGMLVLAAEPEHGDETMEVHFSLALSASEEKQLEERVAKGEVIPTTELDKIYTANPGEADALKAWLKREDSQSRTRVRMVFTRVPKSARLPAASM